MGSDYVDFEVPWRLEGKTVVKGVLDQERALDIARDLLVSTGLPDNYPHTTVYDEPELLDCKQQVCTCSAGGVGVCPTHDPEKVAKIREQIQSAIAEDYEAMTGGDPYGGRIEYPTDPLIMAPLSQDRVNHPAHYLNTNARIDPDEHELIEIDGKMWRPVECIELLRHIKDPRLAHVFVYVWRICFGGKDDDVEDASKGSWFLKDFVEHPPEN